MGLLDGGFGTDDSGNNTTSSNPPPSGGFLSDPRTVGLLGLLGGFNAGIAPYLGASRLPISLGQVLAAGAAGAQQGLLGALNGATERNLRQAQTRNLGLEGDLAQLNLEGWRRYQQQNGGLAPSAATLLSPQPFAP